MTRGQPALSAAKGADGRTVWVSLLMLIAATAGALSGQNRAASADEREIAAYRLTDAALAKYIRASRALAALARPAAADTAEDADDAEDDEDEDGDDDMSIAELTAMYDTIPGAKRAITGAGLTTREFVVFTLTLFQAGMAAWLVEQQGWDKLPAGWSRDNVVFYQRHKAQLDSLTAEMREREP